MVFLKVTDFGSNYIKDKKNKTQKFLFRFFSDFNRIMSVPTISDYFFYLTVKNSKVSTFLLF